MSTQDPGISASEGSNPDDASRDYEPQAFENSTRASFSNTPDEPQMDSDEEELEFFTGSGLAQNEISQIDPDFRQFRAQMRKFANDVAELKAPDIQDGDLGEEDLIAGGPGFNGGARKRGRDQTDKGPPKKRGPRRAASPGGDIKMRLGEANAAFLIRDYKKTKLIIADIIRINAETYEAWTTLAALFQEEGDVDNEFKALFFAAHLRPKHKEPWEKAAHCAFNKTKDPSDLSEQDLQNAQFCLQNALRIDPDDLALRKEKAYVLSLRGQLSLAITEYQNILTKDPLDTVSLQNLSTICIDMHRAWNAIDAYQIAIAKFKANTEKTEYEFTWDDLDYLTELYMVNKGYLTAIEQIGIISRWLLGRKDEEFWSMYTSNDCEWDRDDSRRSRLPDFVPGKYPLSTYGAGLPLQFRVKLALCRLLSKGTDFEEALLHLKWLDPNGGAKQGSCDDCLPLFRQVADVLFEKGYHSNALSYYRPLRQNSEYVDAQYLVNMGTCFISEKQDQDAEECFLEAIKLDEYSIDARMGLAKMYERLSQPEKASSYVEEILVLKSSQSGDSAPLKIAHLPNIAPKAVGDEGPSPSLDENSSIDTRARAHKLRVKSRGGQDAQVQIAKAEHLQLEYFRLNKNQEGMRRGEPAATRVWMEAAEALTQDFRGFKILYPWDKYLPFQGWSTTNARIRAEISLESNLQGPDIHDYIAKGLGVSLPSKAARLQEVDPKTLPKDYRGISFTVWLDIFLEYALLLATYGNMRESYEVCEATKDAVVFYHNRESLFLTHVCYCLCALISNDEETCVGTARFFMKDFQFTTDCYRMFAAITRLCHSPISWYSSGPSQKYILRQIKAMDYALVSKDEQQKFFSERGAYTAKGPDGEAFINKDMDIGLLMLYGHILFTGSSYSYALNYFFRAHALDPNNPMINLNIGLTYIHFGLKRQAENRQHIILQGIAFFTLYYDSRKESEVAEERQEAHYNMGRVYHMLGLPHLAIPYYELVLEDVAYSGRSEREDIVLDTAYNLQTVYAAAGNLKLAEKITREYLTI